MSGQHNPYTSMLSSYDPHAFFGREQETKDILQGISAPEPSSFVISGIRTIGKTALLRYLKHPEGATAAFEEYLAPERRAGVSDELARGLTFIYIDFHGVPPRESVCATLSGHLLAARPNPGRDAGSETAREHTAWLTAALRNELKARHEQGHRVVFLLDDFDAAFKSMTTDEEVQLRTLRDFAAFVVAVEHETLTLRTDITAESAWLGILLQKPLDLLSEAAAERLIRLPLASMSEDGTGPRPDVPPDPTCQECDPIFSDHDVAVLLRIAGRQPFLLTITCAALFDMYMRDPHISALLRDPVTGPEVEERVMRQVSRLPLVNQTLHRFWRRLDDEEKDVVATLAHGAQPDPVWCEPQLAGLTNKALIYQDIARGEFHLFNALFKRFVIAERRDPDAAQHPNAPLDFAAIAAALGQKDRDLFDYLIANPDRVCTFAELLRAGWGDERLDKRALEAAIYRLRKALDHAGVSGWDYLRNVRGVGFEFVPAGAVGRTVASAQERGKRISRGPREPHVI